MVLEQDVTARASCLSAEVACSAVMRALVYISEEMGMYENFFVHNFTIRDTVHIVHNGNSVAKIEPHCPSPS
jgi:hypothetical protein